MKKSIDKLNLKKVKDFHGLKLESTESAPPNLR